MFRESVKNNIIKLSSKDKNILKKIDKSSKWSDIKEIKDIYNEVEPLELSEEFIGLGCSRYLKDSISEGEVDIDEMFRNCREADKVRVRMRKKILREERKSANRKGRAVGSNVSALTKPNKPSEISSNQVKSKYADSKNLSKENQQKISNAFKNELIKNNYNLSKTLSSASFLEEVSGVLCLEGGFHSLSIMLNGISEMYDNITGIGYEDGKWTMSPDIYNGFSKLAKYCGLVLVGNLLGYFDFKGWVKKQLENGKAPRKGQPPNTTSSNSFDGDDDDDSNDGGDSFKEPPAGAGAGSNQVSLKDIQYLLQQNQAQQNTNLINANTQRLFQQQASNPVERSSTPLVRQSPVRQSPTDIPIPPTTDIPIPPTTDIPTTDIPIPQEETSLNSNIIGGIGAGLYAGINYLSNNILNAGNPANYNPVGQPLSGQSGSGVGGTGQELFNNFRNDISLNTPAPNTEPVNINPPVSQQDGLTAQQEADLMEARDNIEEKNKQLKKQQDLKKQEERKVNDYIANMETSGRAWGLVNPLSNSGGKNAVAGVESLINTMSVMGRTLTQQEEDTYSLQKEDTKKLQKTLSLIENTGDVKPTQEEYDIIQEQKQLLGDLSTEKQAKAKELIENYDKVVKEQMRKVIELSRRRVEELTRTISSDSGTTIDSPYPENLNDLIQDISRTSSTNDLLQDISRTQSDISRTTSTTSTNPSIYDTEEMIRQGRDILNPLDNIDLKYFSDPKSVRKISRREIRKGQEFSEALSEAQQLKQIEEIALREIKAREDYIKRQMSLQNANQLPNLQDNILNNIRQRDRANVRGEDLQNIQSSVMENVRDRDRANVRGEDLEKLQTAIMEKIKNDMKDLTDKRELYKAYIDAYTYETIDQILDLNKDKRITVSSSVYQNAEFIIPDAPEEDKEKLQKQLDKLYNEALKNKNPNEILATYGDYYMLYKEFDLTDIDKIKLGTKISKYLNKKDMKKYINDKNKKIEKDLKKYKKRQERREPMVVDTDSPEYAEIRRQEEEEVQRILQEQMDEEEKRLKRAKKK